MQSNINPLCPAGHIAPKVYRIRCIYRKSVRIYIAVCLQSKQTLSTWVVTMKLLTYVDGNISTPMVIGNISNS